MKTPQEKAHELFAFFFCSIDGEDAEIIAKNFATKLVKEIKDELEIERVFEKLDYWDKVQQEIEKL